MGKAIEVKQLKKSFGDVKAVKGIDFYVEQGAMFAFLGPNGAGKSTTIDMLTTYLQRDAGEVWINGCELGREDDRIRASIGIVFQDSLLDPSLTVEENLYVRGSFYNLSRSDLKIAVAKAAKVARITEFMKRPYGKLSGGQRRRADIARALIHTPKILFLDEPTTGLDPQTRKSVWETIRELQQEQGMTIFLTTHYMEEAAQADYITVMDHGEIIARGTPFELKEQYAQDSLKIATRNEAELRAALEAASVSFTLQNGLFHIALGSTIEALPIIDSCRDYISGIEIISGTMDDVFIRLTGAEVRGE